MNKKLVLLGSAGLVLLALGPLWIRSKGGVTNAFNIPLTVQEKQASPALSLRKVEGGFLIVQTELTRKVKDAVHPIEAFYTPGDAFTAVATDSTGQTWRLPWRLHHPPAQFGYYSSNDANDLWITLPDACPPDVQWYDVTVQSKWGDKATWRFTNIQTARHLMEDEPVKTSVTHDGITVSGKAERFFASNSAPGVATINCSLRATGKSASGRSWSVRFAGTNREWEAPSTPTWSGGEDNRIVSLESTNSPLSDVTLHGRANLSYLQTDFSSKFTTTGWSNVWTDHYPQRSHFARLAGAFVLVQLNGKQERILETIPFVLKVPIVFKNYKPVRTKSKT